MGKWGVPQGWGGHQGCPEISGKFPGEILEIPRKFPGGVRGMGPVTKSDIVKRQIKIFTIGLHENDPEIIPDPPVEYLRKYNLPQIDRFFPHPFIYFDHNVYSTYVSEFLKKDKLYSILFTI